MDPADIEGAEDVLRINRSKEKHYAFDYAFDQTTGQVSVTIPNDRKRSSSAPPKA
jgi:hypothetical protein